ACDVVVFFMVLLSFRFDHPEPTAQGKQRHPSGKLQHQPGHPRPKLPSSGNIGAAEDVVQTFLKIAAAVCFVRSNIGACFL
ncbi:hypothetical protein AAFO90_21525, partial [Phaeobacter sp. CAU 1743]|uniref:hypothetical protein n=1 Tax=Phaeobacter sp. CAU 1743 TaxID=3140367 RepID=UPI00325BB0AD